MSSMKGRVLSSGRLLLSMAIEFCRSGRLQWPHRGRLKWPHFASVVVGVDVV